MNAPVHKKTARIAANRSIQELPLEFATILFPIGKPLAFKEAKYELVPIPAVLEVLLAEASFDHVAAVEAISQAAFVERFDSRHYLVQVEGVEGIVEEGHLGIGAIALTPIFFFTDQSTGCADAIPPVDAVDAHETDRLALDFDHKDDIGLGFLARIFQPLALVAFGHREYPRDESPHFWIVDPSYEERDVAFGKRPKDGFLALEEYH